MKKVLYLSYDGMTDPLGQSQVIPYLQGLSKLGYQFTIISFEKKERFKKNGTYIQSLLDASGIKWQPKTFSSRPPVLSKLYDLWKIKKAVLQLHKKEKFSFVHCRSYVAAGAGLNLFRKQGIPFLFDMRGFWVDERLDNGQWRLENPIHLFFYNYYKKREKVYFDKAFHIISLTWKGKEELVNKYGVASDKISVIPCCVDLDLFDYHKVSLETIAAKKKQLNINEHEKVLSYLGSFGGWYLLKEMFDFFIEMKKKIPELKFLFITPSPLESVISAANACGADTHDIIVRAASRQEVPIYLALSDWSVFFIKDGYSKIASSPTKQGEIMAMGIPIICNDVGDTGKIIETSRAGLVVGGFTDAEYTRVISHADALKNSNKKVLRQAAFKYYDLQKGIINYSVVYKSLEC